LLLRPQHQQHTQWIDKQLQLQLFQRMPSRHDAGSSQRGMTCKAWDTLPLLLLLLLLLLLQDAAFLVDLASLQEKHVETAKKLLGQGPELTSFVSRLMDDIGNLKAMLQAICIGRKHGLAAGLVTAAMQHIRMYEASLRGVAMSQ
jgi:hypothetical protein